MGIDTLLAVSLNFPRSIYHLKDVIEGSIKFSLVKLKIKSMSLAIKRKEVLGSGVNSIAKEEEVMSFEIMDGCPTKGSLYSLQRKPYPSDSTSVLLTS